MPTFPIAALSGKVSDAEGVFPRPARGFGLGRDHLVALLRQALDEVRDGLSCSLHEAQPKAECLVEAVMTAPTV